jgi:hypothetical protein
MITRRNEAVAFPYIIIYFTLIPSYPNNYWLEFGKGEHALGGVMCFRSRFMIAPMQLRRPQGLDNIHAGGAEGRQQSAAEPHDEGKGHGL